MVTPKPKNILATPHELVPVGISKRVGRPATGQLNIRRSFCIPRDNYEEIVVKVQALIDFERTQIRHPRSVGIPGQAIKPKEPVKKENGITLIKQKKTEKPPVSDYIKSRQNKKNGVK